MFGRWRHRHEFAVVKSRYLPPLSRARMERQSERVIREAMHGMTSTTLRCKGCGRVEVIESVGDARLPVEIPADLL